MDEAKKASPHGTLVEGTTKNEIIDDIHRVFVEQQSKIINEINSNINEESCRRSDED